VRATVNPSIFYLVLAVLAVLNYFALCIADGCFRKFSKQTVWQSKKFLYLLSAIGSACIGAGSVFVCMLLAGEVFKVQPLVSCIIVIVCIVAPLGLFLLQNYSKKIERK